jgi:hypothetical protein
VNEIPGRVRFRDIWAQRVRLLAVLTAAILFLFYFWPTAWRYDHQDGRVVRFLRVEPSAIQVLSDTGWTWVRANPVIDSTRRR